MPQHITLSAKTMVETARSQIKEHTAADMLALAKDPHVVMVDIRDPRELERDGRIPGAFHATRGMLEFWIDPASPYYKPVFGEDKRFVFFCGSGWRSALATKAAQDMGLKPVASLAGGFTAWKAAGYPAKTTSKPGNSA